MVDKGRSPMIRLRAGNEWYIIPPKLALQVEFPVKAFTSPSKRSRHTYATTSKFLAHFLNSEIAKASVSQSHLDCIIIGPTNRLYEEIEKTLFATQGVESEFVVGSLQEIIRVRKFATDSGTYQSDIYYTHSKKNTEDRQEIPLVIIFDGAASFLKWQASWRFSHAIVLLDQTEPGFDAAIQVFNVESIKNYLDDVVFKSKFKPPKGIHVSVYQEVRK